MNQEKINEAYKKLKIPENMVPNYTNPNEFAKGFKKCSILKDASVTYSGSTIIKQKQ